MGVRSAFINLRSRYLNSYKAGLEKVIYVQIFEHEFVPILDNLPVPGTVLIRKNMLRLAYQV